MSRTAVRNVIVGKPSVLGAIVNEIRERGYDTGRVGIVEYDPYTSIPKNHWDFFTSNLPQVEFVFVTKEFIALRLLKSAEEIQALERSAELGDIGICAMRDRVRVELTDGWPSMQAEVLLKLRDGAVKKRQFGPAVTAEVARGISVGDPLDPRTQLGSR